MVRWGLLILCMMVASLTATGAVHAREFPSPTTVECSGYVHSDGDSDQSQGDSDRAVPHHHGGCHGSVSLVPLRLAEPVVFFQPAEARNLSDTTGAARWSPGPDLRPPIA